MSSIHNCSPTLGASSGPSPTQSSRVYEAVGSTFELDMLGVRRTATVLAEAAHDPANEALRA